MSTYTSVLEKLWTASAPLTAAGVLMLPLLAGSIAGIFLDPRVITGAPAWLKPAKFAISISIYCFTMAWIFTYLPDWPQLTSVTGWITSIVFLVEIAIIALQAARGTTSHFNVATTLDGVLFSIMGAAIGILWFAAIAVTIALFQQGFADAAWGWSLRWGMLISVLGAGIGGIMVSPNRAQLGAARETHRMTVSGAHTVGAPDGGPGLPVTGWSTQYGDLRVPHFLGLHAMQLLPLIGFLISRWSLPPAWSHIAGASYLGAVAILTWQAKRAQPLIAPDPLTLGAWVVWASSTIALLGWTMLRRDSGVWYNYSQL